MATDCPHNNLYTRLKVSSHGVGVFAIRLIPEATELFKGDVGPTVLVPRATINAIEDAELRQMYFDFCPSVNDAFVAPADFNQLTMGWYMNHSATPNVRADRDMQFAAIRSIAAGEELKINYASFSDHAAAIALQWDLQNDETMSASDDVL